MSDQVGALYAESVKQIRQVMRVHQRRMIGDDRTIDVRVVLTAAIKDDAVVFREPIELRQPLAVILETPVDKNHGGPRTGGPVTLVDVMKLDVTAVTVLQDAARQ